MVSDQIIAVVPNARWTYHESKNLTGRPAVHAVRSGDKRTLCGRDCENWMMAGSANVNCKICRRLIQP